MSDLPVTIASTYPDRSAADTAHQEHHDDLHALYNAISGASPDPESVGLVGLLPLFVRKPSDESVSATTSFQTDDHLVLALEASKTYEVTGILLYEADAAADIKMRMLGPTGATGYVSWGGAAGGLGSISGDVNFNYKILGDGTSAGGAGAGTVLSMQYRALIVVDTTPGDVSIQWTQNASNATATIVKAGSYIRAMRVA